jgi:hypothetical protein
MLKIDKIIESIKNFYNTRISTIENERFLKKICSLIIILFFICIIVEIFYEIDSTIALNDYFSIKYKNEIKPKSEMEINSIVTNVKPIHNITEKLNKIAEWETNNFTDQFWERYLNHDIGVKGLNPPISTYEYDNTGQIRALFPPYANDPDWIQFYKFGSCGEEASLFANVTNRSGYPTRMIEVITGFWFYGIPIMQNNHAWVEVNINEEWYFYDPTVFGEYNVLKIESYKNRWFGKTQDYDIFSPDHILSINQFDTQEDVSQRYPKLVNPYLNSYKILW